MQLILHVGLPKTATTTIQLFMDTAKPELAARGVLYPGTTASHMELVRRSQFNHLDSHSGEGSLAEALGWVADEIRAVGPERVVLSCERMILTTAGAVERMQRAVAARLPEVTEVRVLAYVRDPVSWATSLCQQRLKMGTARLTDFAADPWPIRLAGQFETYVRCYGLEAVTLRNLHPGHLVNGNVVDDFLTAIGLEGFEATGPTPILNRSLTAPGALVADVLAGLVPRGSRPGPRKRMYRRLLQAIDGPRFVLPREVQARIIAEAGPDMDYIRQNWGLDLRSVLSDVPDLPGLDDETVRTMAIRLMEDVERRAAEQES